MTVSPSIPEAFRRDGYYIDRRVFAPTERDQLRILAERVRSKTRETLPPGTRYWFGGAEDPATIPSGLKPMATWGVNEITRPNLLEPGLVNVWAHPRVNAMVHALLGPEPRAWGIKILWTPKVAGYDLHWHRDLDMALYDVVPQKPQAQDHIQFNAALNFDDCFVVVPGSHRRTLTDEEWQAVRAKGTNPLPDQVETALEPGDILYMDAHTLHRGRSGVDDDRLTLHYSAQAQWVPLKEWGKADEFAWLQSDAFHDLLEPDTQPLYARLRTAVRTDDASIHIKEPMRFGS